MIAVNWTRLATVVTLLTCAMGLGAGAARAALPQQSGRVDLLSQANVRIDGAAVGSETGVSVAGAGDVNSDGIADGRLSFQGRISRTRQLRPGIYTLTIVAINSGGQRSEPQAPRFAIVEPPS
jgi:hypothetical protein